MYLISHCFKCVMVIADDLVLCHMLIKLNVRTIKLEYTIIEENLYLNFNKKE